MSKSQTRSHAASAAVNSGHTSIFILIMGWFAFILTLAFAGVFERPPGEPPFPTMVAVTIPLLGFFLVYATQERFRKYILGLDLKVLTIIHAWRMVGFSFIVLHMREALPGLFAWPAGLGDMAIALTAPLVVLALLKGPHFATSSRFIWWHVLGLIDFIVAVGTGVLSSGAFPALYQPSVTTAPVAEMALVLIPAFFVPFLAITHFAAILKSLHLRRTSPDYTWDGVPSAT